MTDGNVWRPGVAAIGAIRIKQLRIGIVRGTSAIEPNDIDPSIWSHRKSAKPMPFILIHRIVIDSNRTGKTLAAIGASNKHNISAVIRRGRSDTCEHIDVIICARARSIDCQEDLAGKSDGIDCVIGTDETAKINGSNLVERRRDRAVLCRNRANARNLAAV